MDHACKKIDSPSSCAWHAQPAIQQNEGSVAIVLPCPAKGAKARRARQRNPGTLEHELDRNGKTHHQRIAQPQNIKGRHSAGARSTPKCATVGTAPLPPLTSALCETIFLEQSTRLCGMGAPISQRGSLLASGRIREDKLQVATQRLLLRSGHLCEHRCVSAPSEQNGRLDQDFQPDTSLRCAKRRKIRETHPELLHARRYRLVVFAIEIPGGQCNLCAGRPIQDLFEATDVLVAAGIRAPRWADLPLQAFVLPADDAEPEVAWLAAPCFPGPC